MLRIDMHLIASQSLWWRMQKDSLTFVGDSKFLHAILNDPAYSKERTAIRDNLGVLLQPVLAQMEITKVDPLPCKMQHCTQTRAQPVRLLHSRDELQKSIALWNNCAYPGSSRLARSVDQSIVSDTTSCTSILSWRIRSSTRSWTRRRHPPRSSFSSCGSTLAMIARMYV